MLGELYYEQERVLNAGIRLKKRPVEKAAWLQGPIFIPGFRYRIRMGVGLWHRVGPWDDVLKVLDSTYLGEAEVFLRA